MNTVVNFDGLGISFPINNVAFSFELFGKQFSIYWYGVIIALGFALAIVYACTRCKDFNLNTDKMLDAIIAGTIGGVVGARLYYVIFQWEYYAKDLKKIFAITEGGLAIYGGIIGAFLVGGIVCKIKKINVLDMFDLASIGFLMAQAIGRWGNFFNQEAYGTTTNLPWAMKSEKIWNELAYTNDKLIEQGIRLDLNALGVHPTFLYESLWCILGFVLLHIVSKKFRRFKGQIVLLYGIWYGIERMVVEGLRTDSLYIQGTVFRISQVFSALLIVVCVIIYIYLNKKSKVKQYVPILEKTENENISLENLITENDEVDDKNEIQDVNKKGE